MKLTTLRRRGACQFAVLATGLLALSGEPAAAGSSPAPDQDTLIKLQAMSDQERARLDDRMSQALQLYYDAHYASALPIFREIADRVETMDLKFWIGRSAEKTGDYRLAIGKFKEMLEVDPNLYRVRLELADALFNAGRRGEAREELLVVRASSPPPEVVRNIDRRLIVIGQSREKSKWGFNLSTGMQHDSNIGSGPDSSEIAIATGTLTLTGDQQEVSGNNRLIKAAGMYLYDAGEPGAGIFNARFNVYDAHNDETSDVNFSVADLAIGGLWAMDDDVIRFPVGYRYTRYGGEHLSNTLHFDPSVRFGKENYGLVAGYTYARESYIDSIHSGNDNTMHRLSIGPDFFLGERKYAITALLSWEKRDADSNVFSYDGPALELSCFTRLAEATQLFLKYKRLRRNYDAPPPLFASKRVDDRDTVTIALSQRYRDRYFGSLNYVYLNNDSNAALYEFKKHMFTLELGMTF